MTEVNKAMNELIKAKLASLPESPGSYRMLSSEGTIIYVGKAKNLRNRVRSYFSGCHDQKTEALVANIHDFDYIVTQSEVEAFLLELSLIKEHMPRYNILLMDDKTYPYIEITQETHPKLVITRKPKGTNKYRFGPYPDQGSARETLELLNRIFPFRKCPVLPDKVCLYYHIGQCLGPCETKVEPKVYLEMAEKIRRFLDGSSSELCQELKAKMADQAQRLEFEKAKVTRDLLQALEKTTEKQKIIFADKGNRDIASFVTYDHYLAVAILFMRQGRIIFSENRIMDIVGDSEEAFLSFMAQFYETSLIPEEILLPRMTDLSLLAAVVENKAKVPKKGKKAELVQMATENARIHFETNLERFLKKHEKTIGAVDKLGELLGMEPPLRIEAFDNSNLQGTFAVSSMVMFINGLPAKKEYRKYRVKTVKGPDDIQTMKEIIYRRYQRLLMEGGPRPDLIIMDGGLLQVRAAKEVLAGLYLDIPVAGLQKDPRHQTDVLIGLKEEGYPLDRHDSLYVFLNKIQEEAHRFAIEFFRKRKSKEIYASLLDAIPKIGSKTKMKLLRDYKTLENIRQATDEELKASGLKKDQIENLRIGMQK